VADQDGGRIVTAAQPSLFDDFDALTVAPRALGRYRHAAVLFTAARDLVGVVAASLGVAS